MSRRIYKTPSRRRLKKWRKRAFRLITRSRHRGFRWFLAEMLQCFPLIEAAKRTGVDLSRELNERFGGPVNEEDMVAFMLGSRCPWPSKRNLEI